MGSAALLGSALGFVLLFSFAGCTDPLHEQQVQALGPEDPSVSKGPLHRPGQPCLVCHGALGPASGMFVMAGTVYALPDSNVPAPNTQVTVEDVRGSTFTATTNAAGNFFITPDQWSIDFPAQVSHVIQGTLESPKMFPSLINRDGSCADCHGLQVGPTSPGRVYLHGPLSSGATSDDGGP
jgi:hypothetical protein